MAARGFQILLIALFLLALLSSASCSVLGIAGNGAEQKAKAKQFSNRFCSLLSKESRYKCPSGSANGNLPCSSRLCKLCYLCDASKRLPPLKDRLDRGHDEADQKLLGLCLRYSNLPPVMRL